MEQNNGNNDANGVLELKLRIAEEGSSSRFKRQERYPGVVHECVWYIHDSRFISGKKKN
jgi:hypothetical protein